MEELVSRFGCPSIIHGPPPDPTQSDPYRYILMEEIGKMVQNIMEARNHEPTPSLVIDLAILSTIISSADISSPDIINHDNNN